MMDMHPSDFRAPAATADRAARRNRLFERRAVLREYLAEVTKEEDWHGVMDAAADLREVDAELRGLDL